MKLIKQDVNIRLVKTIGGRYEVQEKYYYWNDDRTVVYDWSMISYSDNLKQACEIYDKSKVVKQQTYLLGRNKEVR